MCMFIHIRIYIYIYVYVYILATENVKKEERSFHSDCRFPIHYNVYIRTPPPFAGVYELAHT
jgi:hypothetical protein